MMGDNLDPKNLFHIAMIGHAEEVTAYIKNALDEMNGFRISRKRRGFFRL